MNNVTATDIITMRKILRLGGKVTAAMGKARDDRVNKRTVARLVTMGLIVVTGNRHNVPGPTKIDATVTAAGCNELAHWGIDFSCALQGDHQ